MKAPTESDRVTASRDAAIERASKQYDARQAAFLNAWDERVEGYRRGHLDTTHDEAEVAVFKAWIGAGAAKSADGLPVPD